ARKLAVPGDAHLERHTVTGELIFGTADEADLRQAVDADRRKLVGAGAGGPRRGGRKRLAAGVVGREPALLHGSRRERREADDVADGVDVRCGRAEVLVDLDAASVVG